MQKLIEKYNRLLTQRKKIYYRDIFKKFTLDGRIIGIVGSRGIGKTTFILDLAKRKYGNSEKALYVSADDPYFLKNALVDCAENFVSDYDGKLLLIDEIHRYKNWDQELKNIYDFFPKLKIVFSGSSSINLVHGQYDLSRRAIIYHLNGFSFREFLEYKYGIRLKAYTLEKLIKNRVSISKELLKVPKLSGYFKEYLKIGYYPFEAEFKKAENFYQALGNIIDKAIYEDIASLYSLRTSNLIVFKKLLYFLATTEPGEININKLAKSLRKDNKTILEYLMILRETGFIKFLSNNKSGHSLVRSLEKIYLDNTVLLSAINFHLGKMVKIGQVREIFICNQLENIGRKVFYTRNGDIITGKYTPLEKAAKTRDSLTEYTFEVGGKSKSNKQIKNVKNSYLILDDIIIADKRKIPLYLFGFLY